MLLSSTYVDKLVALAVDEAHCYKAWLVCTHACSQYWYPFCVYFRGEDFQAAFNYLGDLCNIVPPKVRIIALTATATAEVLRTVTHKLCLENPSVIGLTPNRENIKYSIEPLPKIELLCELFTENLCHMRTGFPKTLVLFHHH